MRVPLEVFKIIVTKGCCLKGARLGGKLRFDDKFFRTSLLLRVHTGAAFAVCIHMNLGSFTCHLELSLFLLIILHFNKIGVI